MIFSFCPIIALLVHSFFFFFNDTATTEIYTLSLHDALPILRHCAEFTFDTSPRPRRLAFYREPRTITAGWVHTAPMGRGITKMNTFRTAFVGDRKSTRLNSSHGYISYAVFCLKKKKNKIE